MTALLAFALACSTTALVGGGPAPGPTPFSWSAAPGRKMLVDARPLGIDPDGAARWLVRARFVDAGGRSTELLHGGDVEFRTSRGDVQWQTRNRFGGPAAIIRTSREGPISVRAIVVDPIGFSDVRVTTDTRAWLAPKVVVRSLGPHMVQVGWFPESSGVRVVRSGPDGTRIVCTAPGISSTCRDATVAAGSSYRYSVTQLGGSSRTIDVAVPPDIQRQSLRAFAGKGAWLRYSPDARDDDSYTRLDANAIVTRAKRAGLRYLELRLAYGEFWEVSATAKPYVDGLIDAAARQGIAVIAWTVPRAPTFDDVALAVQAANYRTASGTPVAGLAIDFERGSEYMGEGSKARAALTTYANLARQALGPSYLIIATVEDAYLVKLDNEDFPYAAIASNANALQSMSYWRMFQAGIGSAATAAVTRRSLAALRQQAHSSIPINLGGQTSNLGSCGAPPVDEILASLNEARKMGAFGETFFDWFGTIGSQWDAIGSFSW
jgi:hypothetical protein